MVERSVTEPRGDVFLVNGIASIHYRYLLVGLDLPRVLVMEIPVELQYFYIVALVILKNASNTVYLVPYSLLEVFRGVTTSLAHTLLTEPYSVLPEGILWIGLSHDLQFAKGLY